MELRVMELVLEAEQAANAALHRHDPPAYAEVQQDTRRGRWQAFVSGVGALVAAILSVGGR